MALIGQVFGDQNTLMDQARQMAAASDYQRAFAQHQQAQQYQAQRQGLSGIGSGSIQGNSLSSKQPTKPKEGKAMPYVRDYFIKHRELLMGLTLVILLDHFIFAGAFREKIQKIVQSILDKTEKKLCEA